MKNIEGHSQKRVDVLKKNVELAESLRGKKVSKEAAANYVSDGKDVFIAEDTSEGDAYRAAATGDLEEFIDDQIRLTEKYENIALKNEEDYAKTGRAVNRDIAETNRKTAKRFRERMEIAEKLRGKKITFKEAGQLFRVDIPENDVLLDWDRQITEQPEAVRSALEKIAGGIDSHNEFIVDGQRVKPRNETQHAALRAAKKGTLESLIRDYESMIPSVNEDTQARYRGYIEFMQSLRGKEVSVAKLERFDKYMTGEHVYHYMENKLGSDKAASLLLNEHGVKGLRYLDGNSRASGEGTHNFVIFDENAIEILETYYQAALDEHTKRVNAIKNMQSTPVTPGAHLDKKGAEAVARGFGTITNKADGRTASIPVATVGKIVGQKGFDISTIIEHLPRMFENSLPAWSESEIKREGHKEHPNLAAFHHYVNKFTDDSGTYFIRFTANERKARAEKTADTYVHATAISDVNVYKENDAPQSGRVIDPVREGTPFVDKRLLEFFGSVNSLKQGQGDETIRGSYDRAERLISLFKGQNESTFVHEIGHAFLEDLIMMAAREGASEQVKRDWETAREWMGMGDEQGRPTREQHEKFADGFLHYLHEGKAPTPGLRGVFMRFKNWLAELIRTGEIQNIEMSDEIRGVYDRLLAMPDEVDATYAERSTLSDVGAQIRAARDEVERVDRLMEAMNSPDALDDLMARVDAGELETPETIIEEIAQTISEWDALEAQHEVNQASADSPRSRKNVVGFIKANGGINYQSIKDRYGPVDSAELRKKLGPGMFRKNGFGLDEFVAMMEHEGANFEAGDDIFNVLMSDDTTDDALAAARRMGIEEGKAAAGRFMDIYNAWKTVLKGQRDGALPNTDELFKTGVDAIDTIAKLTSENEELSSRVEELGARVSTTVEDSRELAALTEAMEEMTMKAPHPTPRSVTRLRSNKACPNGQARLGKAW
jgi:hypothetical protein